MNGFASLKNSPHNKTTVVVPSPTSASCDRAMSTKVFTAGWTISNNFMIVAPSLVIVVTPRLSTTNLSNPRGPKVVRMVSTMAMHALMFEINWPLPCEVSVPSFNKTICGSVLFFKQQKKKKKKIYDEYDDEYDTQKEENECMCENK